MAEEYRSLKGQEKNSCKKTSKDGAAWYDYVEGIDYNGHRVNLVEYRENRELEYQKGKKKGQGRTVKKEFLFLTDLPVCQKNVEALVCQGRMRWKIENEGFNTQKRHGYCLEHQYSKDYQAQKCHYYLIQIGHMISQVLEAWGKVWEKAGQSREQKHRRVLESFKAVRLKEAGIETRQRIQIRLT